MAEWYDANAALIRRYQFLFYAKDNSIEMVGHLISRYSSVIPSPSLLSNMMCLRCRPNILMFFCNKFHLVSDPSNAEATFRQKLKGAKIF